jgi:hypothetical protein
MNTITLTKEQANSIEYYGNRHTIKDGETYYEYCYDGEKFFTNDEDFKMSLVEKSLFEVILLKSKNYYDNYKYTSLISYKKQDGSVKEFNTCFGEPELTEEEEDGILQDLEPNYLNDLKSALWNIKSSLREGDNRFSYYVYEIKQNLDFIASSMTDETGRHLGDGFVFILIHLYEDSIQIHSKNIQDRLMIEIYIKVCTACIIQNGSGIYSHTSKHTEAPFALKNSRQFINFLSRIQERHKR